MPPSHWPSGSAPGSSEVVAPARRARRRMSPSSSPPPCRKNPPVCTWLLRSSNASGTSAAVIAPIVPGNVMVARSPGSTSTVERPVGRLRSTASASVTTPAASSRSRMKAPNRSSPTIPAMAVRRPRRAAPHAVIELDPPTTSSASSTQVSPCPNCGRSEPPASTRSGLQSPATSRSKSRMGRPLSHAATAPRAGPVSSRRRRTARPRAPARARSRAPGPSEARWRPGLRAASRSPR